MKVLSLNLNKIACEKSQQLKNTTINNNIEFTNFEKAKIDVISEDSGKINFKYSLTYSSERDSEKLSAENTQGAVLFEGFLVLSLTKKELEDFEQSWKKKIIPEEHVIPLYNYIIRKCATKAIPLQEEVGLPFPYVKYPSLTKKTN